MRAPLRAIGGYARLIEDACGPSLSQLALEHLGKISHSALILGQLIDGLLELSQIQRSALVIEELEMAALVQEVWAELGVSRGEREIHLTLGDLPTAMGDRQMIRWIWRNLLDNAIKFTEPRSPGQIEVSADQSDEVVRYQVEDSGVGFDMKYAHKIGQVFQRLHHASEFPGNGIGLAGVKLIVLRHGGAFSIDGRLNQGVVVKFSLWHQE
jgi:light-regulated signal transduction histidine kinase (bacteriophytochrome)